MIPWTFERDGYALLPGFISGEPLAAAQAAIEALSVGDVPATYEPQYERPDDPRVRKVRRLYWNDPTRWAAFIVGSGMDELAAERLGPDAGLMLHAGFLKPAGVGGEVALHQDQALWDYDHPGAFSVWVALTDVHPGNGGLAGCPGSHRFGAAAHQQGDGYQWHHSIEFHDAGFADPVPFDLSPGDAVMWDRYFAHSSAGNASDEDRRGVVFVFAPAASEAVAYDWASLADVRRQAASALETGSATEVRA